MPRMFARREQSDNPVPERHGACAGQIYSLNDARYFDWPEGLRRYIDTVRQGKGQNPKQYSARYICSLVADFHRCSLASCTGCVQMPTPLHCSLTGHCRACRTLLYGGIAANPRSHLRLVYEGNPLAYLAEQACCHSMSAPVTCMHALRSENLAPEINAAHACMQAGGRASDGKRRILDIDPEKLHQRLPLFLGSPADIAELESYGDVQQLKNPGYNV